MGNVPLVGGLGVWLFFVLSGFLITRILIRERELVELGDKTPVQALSKFYWRRTLRIFPIYYVLLAAVATLAIFMPLQHATGREYLAYVTYTTNLLVWRTDQWPGSFSHLWSLAVEEQFYLGFAPLILLIPRRWSALVCFVMVLLGLGVKIALVLAHQDVVRLFVESFTNFSIMALGGLTGVVSQGRRVPAWIGRAQVQAGLMTAIGLSAVVLAMTGASLVTWGGFIPALCALLILAVEQGQDTWIVRVLDTWPMRSLGMVSYGFYLFHNFIPTSLVSKSLGHVGVHNAFVTEGVQFALAVGLATASWVMIEKPLSRFKDGVPFRQAAARA